MNMSGDAEATMRLLAEEYLAAGHPDHKLWSFPTANSGRTFAELRAADLLEPLGPHAEAYRLTDAGLRWVLRFEAFELAASGIQESRGASGAMFNLLVTSQPGAWSQDSTYSFPRSRYLEQTESRLRESLLARGDDAFKELSRLPSLFAYEAHIGAPARVGRIIAAQAQETDVRVFFRLDTSTAPVAPERLEALKWELQIAERELNRTHWTVKTASLTKVLDCHSVANAATFGSVAPHVSASRPKVFVVHGHHDGAKHEVARFLETIGLHAVILHEQPNRGRTLITKFAEESADIQFAVVLMTADDIGSAQAGPRRARARQNVIFELGFFVGKLGLGRVCALVAPDLEKPSDIDGLVYVQYATGGGWKSELARELRHAGVAFDPSRVF